MAYVSVTGWSNLPVSNISFEQSRTWFNFSVKNTGSATVEVTSMNIRAYRYDDFGWPSIEVGSNWSGAISKTIAAGKSISLSGTQAWADATRYVDVYAATYDFSILLNVGIAYKYNGKAQSTATFDVATVTIPARPTKPTAIISGANSFGSVQNVVANGANGSVSYYVDNAAVSQFTPQLTDTPNASSKTYSAYVVNYLNGFSVQSDTVYKTFNVPSYTPTITTSTDALTAYNDVSPNKSYTGGADDKAPCVNFTGVKTGTITVGNLNGANVSVLKVTPKYPTGVTSGAVEAEQNVTSGGRATWDKALISGARTFEVYLKDTRGKEVRKSLTATFAAYTAPTVTATALKRTSAYSSEEEDESGEYLFVNAEWSPGYIADADKSASVARYEVTRSGSVGAASSWAKQELSPVTVSKQHLSAAGFSDGGPIVESSDVSYTFVASVTDKYGVTVTSSLEIAPSIPMLDFGAGGKSVGIHAVANPSADIERELLIGCKVKIPGMAGIIYPFAGSAAPEGFLMCDGASYLRSQYPELFAVIGTIYGAADSTHFNVPDLRGRVAIGSSGSHALGTKGGAETHNHIAENMRAKIGASSGNPQTINYVATDPWDPNTGSTQNGTYSVTGASWSGSNGFSHYTPVVGYTDAKSNMQPYAVTNYIISTGVNAAPYSDSETRGSMFVSDLSITNSISGVVNDYPIARGVSTVGAVEWEWVKFKSGRCELWGQVPFGAMSYNGATGQNYYTATYPFPMKSAPFKCFASTVSTRSANDYGSVHASVRLISNTGCQFQAAYAGSLTIWTTVYLIGEYA